MRCFELTRWSVGRKDESGNVVIFGMSSREDRSTLLELGIANMQELWG